MNRKVNVTNAFSNHHPEIRVFKVSEDDESCLLGELGINESIGTFQIGEGQLLRITLDQANKRIGPSIIELPKDLPFLFRPHESKEREIYYGENKLTIRMYSGNPNWELFIPGETTQNSSNLLNINETLIKGNQFRISRFKVNPRKDCKVTVSSEPDVADPPPNVTVGEDGPGGK